MFWVRKARGQVAQGSVEQPMSCRGEALTPGPSAGQGRRRPAGRPSPGKITLFSQDAWKIQSSLSVNSDVSEKSKVNAVFPQKTGSSREDCSVYCILALGSGRACDFLTLSSTVLGQASRGVATSETCCCRCGEQMGEDCPCPCEEDCGIVDACRESFDCCESLDCLEVCMECCGICFPSLCVQTGVF
uniref:MyoD family inhibitor domain-containing protein n=1 Tax=Ursus maritimus TaxID=29073 RepID=A0A452U5G4_URSMA